jgi:hypothetical protein
MNRNAAATPKRRALDFRHGPFWQAWGAGYFFVLGILTFLDTLHSLLEPTYVRRNLNGLDLAIAAVIMLAAVAWARAARPAESSSPAA